MRHDRETLGDALADSPEWEKRNARFKELFIPVTDENGDKVLRAYPFSAHERNAFFANQKGQSFSAISPLSGIDTSADSRSFALLDYDRDGDQDFAMANANTPSFELYQTQVPTPGNFIAIKLEGGARPDHSTKGSPGLSNRDAIGARLTISMPDKRKLTRVLNAGEGYGAQNSKTLIIGLGKSTQAQSIHIQWPSGKTQTISSSIPHGQLLSIQEEGNVTRTRYVKTK